MRKISRTLTPLGVAVVYSLFVIGCIAFAQAVWNHAKSADALVVEYGEEK